MGLKITATDSELKRQYESGMRLREIAEMYGCTVGAVMAMHNTVRHAERSAAL